MKRVLSVRHAPVALPVCAEPSCLMCVIRQGERESRMAFIARLRVLYITGSLSVLGRRIR